MRYAASIRCKFIIKRRIAMKVARILKVIAIVEWVLGFIFGILSGIGGSYIYLYSYSGGFNFLSMLLIWFTFFAMGMLQYGFAELLEHVAMMRQRTEEQLYYLTGAVQHLEGAVTKKNPAENNVK